MTREELELLTDIPILRDFETPVLRIVSCLLRVIWVCDLQYGALALAFHDFAFFKHFF